MGVIPIVKPNEYILGGTEQLRAKFENEEGYAITPTEFRISVKEPSGDIITVSGGGLVPHTTLSGVFYYLYRPPVVGWYEYESWGKDGNGNEVVETNGFEVTDRLFPDT